MLTDLPAIVNGHNNNNNNNNSNSNNNNELNGDSQLADLSQTRLRNLIESIIAETLRSSSANALIPSGAVSEISLDTRSNGQLSVLSNGNKRRHRTEHYFEPKIYQDLLATAVLNKVRQTRHGSNCCMWQAARNLAVNHFDPPCNPCRNFRLAFPFIRPRYGGDPHFLGFQCDPKPTQRQLPLISCYPVLQVCSRNWRTHRKARKYHNCQVFANWIIESGKTEIH